MPAVRYQPFYCEENIWWLCQEPRFAALEPAVVFISNAARRCALWRQKTGDPVLWDYHVVLLVAAEVWDLDTRLELPTSLDRYLEQTFRPLSPEHADLAPLFRVVEASAFLARFGSDRRHMRDEAGRWREPPPPWEPPFRGEHNLSRFVDMADDIAGEVLTLAEIGKAGG